jgi:hypothetical protein
MKFLDANFGGAMYNFEVVILALSLFDRNFRQIFTRFSQFLKTSHRILGAVIRQIIQDFNHIPLI